MRFASVGLLLALVACGEARPTMLDGGMSDAAIEVCIEPDRVCPDTEPFPGSPCEGTLSCTYGGGIATCIAGEWTWESLCDGGCAPPLVESCAEPFAGSLPSATVAIGPDEPGPFRPFGPGEHVAAIHGPQGGSMIAYRLRVSDPGGSPVCVATDTTLTYDTMAPYAVSGTVELHCGQTLRVYAVLPDRPCETREYPTTLEVDVAGVGTATASLVIDGSPCPR